MTELKAALRQPTALRACASSRRTPRTLAVDGRALALARTRCGTLEARGLRRSAGAGVVVLHTRSRRADRGRLFREVLNEVQRSAGARSRVTGRPVTRTGRPPLSAGARASRRGARRSPSTCRSGTAPRRARARGGHRRRAAAPGIGAGVDSTPVASILLIQRRSASHQQAGRGLRTNEAPGRKRRSTVSSRPRCCHEVGDPDCPGELSVQSPLAMGRFDVPVTSCRADLGLDAIAIS